MPTWNDPRPGRSPHTCQVLVVGGGPGGSAAAHELGAAGIDTLVVERGDRNRDKACGDMFMPSAVAAMANMGVDCAWLDGNTARSFDGVELRGAKGHLWTVRYPHERIWVIPRAIIDQKLRDAIPRAVRMLYDAAATRIAEIAPGELSVTVRLSHDQIKHIRCEAVILAAGTQRYLSETWGVSGRPRIAPSISAYAPLDQAGLPMFEFTAACRPGYRWLFPSPGGYANIGICSLKPVNGHYIKTSGMEFLDSKQLSTELRWRGGAGALWSGSGSVWHHSSGVIACGDAAGLVDPVNGEGLTAALVSGQAAGVAAAQFILHRRRSSILAQYSHWVKATFSAKYASSPGRTVWKQLSGWAAA